MGKEQKIRRSGFLPSRDLQFWGMLFVALGIAGRAIVENVLLEGRGDGTLESLASIVESSPLSAHSVSMAIIFRSIQTVATPIFAFLLVEGIWNTSDSKKYFLRLLGLAVLCEIPYNLAMGGSWLVLSSRNPVFGLVFGLVMLMFMMQYQGGGVRNAVLKAAVILAALVWVMLLRVDHGAELIVMAAVFWLFYDKPKGRALAGAIAMFACVVFSVYNVLGAAGCLLVLAYNEEWGYPNRYFRYLSYPVLLAVFAVISWVLPMVLSLFIQ